MSENLHDSSVTVSKPSLPDFRSRVVTLNPFRVDLALFTITRTIIDTGHRMIIAFLPVISRGLGEDLQTIGVAISLCYLLGVFTPLASMFSENKGAKWGVVLGIMLVVFGYALFFIIPEFKIFIVMLVLSSLGRIFFNPSMQAYIGTFSNHLSRGFALSLPEMGWSLAAIAGVPLVSLLISRHTWVAPFSLLAGVGLSLAALLFVWLSGENKRGTGEFLGIKESIAGIVHNKSLVFLLAALLLVATGHAIITIVYSTHFESKFDFQIAALGGMSLAIGLVELGGESLSAFFTDRLKPGVTIGIGVLFHITGALAMSLMGGSLAGAVICLVIIFLSYEFFIVGLIPYIFHIVDENRLTSLSMRVMVNQAGVALGVFLGPFLYGIRWEMNYYSAAALDLAALLLIFLLINKTKPSKNHTMIGAEQ